MRKSALLRAAAVLAAVLWAMPASAQELRGAIEGTIRDNSGGVLPGVTVQAINVATNAVHSAVTDANGVYRFPALAPGSYEVSASLSGFVPAKLSGQLLLGQLLKVDIVLTIAALAETVEVRGDPVALTFVEFELLALLASEPGVVFSRRQLLERIRGSADYREPRTIDVHVRHLREKIERDSREPELILTVRGAGYRFRDGG